MRFPNTIQESHKESLEEEATHATDEARMVLPGVQAILGFQLIAVFNQRFQELTEGRQVLHLGAFLLLAVAMALIMAPAAYHRQAERGCVTRRFVNLASCLLTVSLVPLAAGIAIDAYLLMWLVIGDDVPSLLVAATLMAFLVGLWFGMPQLARAGGFPARTPDRRAGPLGSGDLEARVSDLRGRDDEQTRKT